MKIRILKSMVLPRIKYPALLLLASFGLCYFDTPHASSDETKYVVVWSSNSPHGPIAGIARNFDQITFNNLEDCQDQIAKELFDNESYGDWAMMKSYYGDTNRIGARLKEDADNYNARTLYICDTLEPYPD